MSRDAGGFMTFMWSLGTQRDRRNKVAHTRWSLLLAASVAASALLLRTGFANSTAMKATIIAVPIALLVPWLRAYLRFLREADELVRQIHMEAAAIGFWAGFASGIGFVVLGYAGLPQPHPSMAVAIIVAVMGASYTVARIFTGKRYR